MIGLTGLFSRAGVGAVYTARTTGNSLRRCEVVIRRRAESVGVVAEDVEGLHIGISDWPLHPAGNTWIHDSDIHAAVKTSLFPVTRLVPVGVIWKRRILRRIRTTIGKCHIRFAGVEKELRVCRRSADGHDACGGCESPGRGPG